MVDGSFALLMECVPTSRSAQRRSRRQRDCKVTIEWVLWRDHAL